jgi:hypothetical protein
MAGCSGCICVSLCNESSFHSLEVVVLTIIAKLLCAKCVPLHFLIVEIVLILIDTPSFLLVQTNKKVACGTSSKIITGRRTLPLWFVVLACLHFICMR